MADGSPIAIVGAGMMGAGIAAAAALAGTEVALFDVAPARAEAAVAQAHAHLRQLAEGGLVSEEAAREAATRLHPSRELVAAVTGACWVIEAISEDLAAKQALFATLEGLVGPDVMLTSNTSGLRISDIVRHVQSRTRTATTHFWFPAHLVPLVEIVMTAETDPLVAERLQRILLGWGKAPVIVRRDLPGQLANRILQAVIREATAIVESGLASAADVDTAVKMGMGLRFPAWGPLEHVDTVGLELCAAVQRTVLPSLCNEPHPVALFDRLLAEGRRGVVSGQGFYDWSCRSHAELVAERDRFLLAALRLLGWGVPASCMMPQAPTANNQRFLK